MPFARFYLDKEKDICVTMDRNEEGQMAYVLTTPNHSTGNLIRNLAALCNLPLTRSAEGYFIIQGIVPAYYDGNCRLFYLFSLGDREAARIESDGHVHLYVQIPAIAKTLMSQTRDYQLSFAKTIVRTRIPAECKFRTDLHTHMNATLSPDQLIALGIVHQIRYSLYYIRKLHLRLRPEQEQVLRILRTDAEAQFLASGSTLTGKYKDRKINDNVFINFADLILNNLENAEYNIPRIRASLAIMKDSQAVFTNLEKVYLYRYVFAKGVSSSDWIPLHDSGSGYCRYSEADAGGPSDPRLPAQYAVPGQDALDGAQLPAYRHLLCRNVGYDLGEAEGSDRYAWRGTCRNAGHL